MSKIFKNAFSYLFGIPNVFIEFKNSEFTEYNPNTNKIFKESAVFKQGLKSSPFTSYFNLVNWHKEDFEFLLSISCRNQPESSFNNEKILNMIDLIFYLQVSPQTKNALKDKLANLISSPLNEIQIEILENTNKVVGCVSENDLSIYLLDLKGQTIFLKPVAEKSSNLKYKSCNFEKMLFVLEVFRPKNLILANLKCGNAFLRQVNKLDFLETLEVKNCKDLSDESIRLLNYKWQKDSNIPNNIGSGFSLECHCASPLVNIQ